MDHPKTNADVIWIADLPVSTLLLFRDQRFKGYCILSFAPYPATRLEDLIDDDYDQFCRDLRTSSRALRAAFAPDHMNYELLGNSNPHLHWHVIPRYRDDPRWGRPIWEDYPRGEFTHNRHTVDDSVYETCVARIRTFLPPSAPRQTP